MMYELGKSLKKDDDYLIFIDLFLKDVSSWCTLYIAFDDSMENYAIEIKRVLESKGVLPFIYREGMEGKFEDAIAEGDCLLVLSGGIDDFVTDMVGIARSKNARVYGICFDGESPLVALLDEVLVISHDFENYMELFSMTLSGKYLNRTSRPGVHPDTPGSLVSTMQGFVIEVRVKAGDRVKKGDCVCVIEAMKMENEIQSDVEGTVEEVFIKPGDFVQFDRDVLMTIR